MQHGPHRHRLLNNGRIPQTTDNITSEQGLSRLMQSASSVTGTMPFAYDGFGNLTQQGQTYGDEQFVKAISRADAAGQTLTQLTQLADRLFDTLGSFTNRK